MSRVEGYNVYQSSYYDSTTKSKGKERTDKSGQAAKAGKTGQTKELSVKAKRLLEELKSKYKNMDFMVADYDTDEEAASYLSRGTKEYSVLFDVDELEKMAADETVKEQNLKVLDGVADKFADLKEQLGDAAKDVTHLGIVIDNSGEVSYFAELEQNSARQREWIEKNRAEKKEQAREDKKAQEEKLRENWSHKGDELPPGYTKKTRVNADSIEALAAGIKAVDWGKVPATKVSETGSKLDFTV